MFVKICGITRAEDAAVAVAHGAMAIGFIFWPKSRRYVEPAQARAIVRTLLPFVTPVGVFVNESVDVMNAVAAQVGLGAVQLHGDESPDMLDAIVPPVVKAVGRIDEETATRWPSRVRLLVDADDQVHRGGTGMKADWAGAAILARRRPIVLAGGLTPENVAEAVTTVRPFGIDVSSGVEDAPGIKNPEKLRALFEALRGVARS
ncbi:MAG: phosphoribosylanthranilate isomerase [Vicinamibacterales bacterium]